MACDGTRFANIAVGSGILFSSIALAALLAGPAGAVGQAGTDMIPEDSGDVGVFEQEPQGTIADSADAPIVGAPVATNPGISVLDDSALPVQGATYLYRRAVIGPVSNVTDGDASLNHASGDYIIRYMNNKTAPDALGPDGVPLSSTAFAEVKLASDPSGASSQIISFNIRKANLADESEVFVSGISQQDTSSVPTISMRTIGGDELIKGTDYDVSVSSSENGKATLVISSLPGPQSLCAGTIEKTFSTIDTHDISAAFMDIIPDQDWTGEPACPTPTIRIAGKDLVENRDYELSYADNVDPGTASITATGIGDYSGKLSSKFSITGGDGSMTQGALSHATISPIPDQAYTGKELKPQFSVVVDGKELKTPEDYTFRFSRNVNAGNAAVLRINGHGKYEGATRTATFKIRPADISKASISGLSDQRFTGGQITPNVNVTLNVGGTATVLSSPRDYTVSYKSNSMPGTASIVLSGSGNFTGTKTAQFKIIQNSNNVEEAEVSGFGPFYTTSISNIKKKTLTKHLKVKLNGTTLKMGTDYSISIPKKYLSNPKPGKATATITGKGKYTGKKTVEFEYVNMGDDLARTACKLSYSRPAYANAGNGHPGGYYGTTQYIKAIKKHVPGYMGSYKGRACHQGMRIVLYHSGYWTKKSGEDVSNAPRSNWAYIGTYGEAKDKLLPGDFLSTPNTHYYMYVGKDIPDEVYASYLKGRGEDGGDLGKPTKKAAWVSSHYAGGTSSVGSSALCIGGSGFAHVSDRSRIYRCVKPKDKDYRPGNIVKK